MYKTDKILLLCLPEKKRQNSLICDHFVLHSLELFTALNVFASWWNHNFIRFVSPCFSCLSSSRYFEPIRKSNLLFNFVKNRKWDPELWSTHDFGIATVKVSCGTEISCFCTLTICSYVMLSRKGDETWWCYK